MLPSHSPCFRVHTDWLPSHSVQCLACRTLEAWATRGGQAHCCATCWPRFGHRLAVTMRKLGVGVPHSSCPVHRSGYRQLAVRAGAVFPVRSFRCAKLRCQAQRPAAVALPPSFPCAQELDVVNPLNNRARHVCFIGADQHGGEGIGADRHGRAGCQGWVPPGTDPTNACLAYRCVSHANRASHLPNGSACCACCLTP